MSYLQSVLNSTIETNRHTASGVVAFSNEIKLGLQNGTYEPHGAYTLAGQFNIPLVKFNVLLDTNE